MTSTLIVNARLVNEGREFDGDLRFADGRIDQIGSGLAAREGEAVIDAAGRRLLPGMIDDQVHFREPGMEYKADIATESAAAVAGGLTSFMDMPNTNPPTLDAAALEDKYRRAAGRAAVGQGEVRRRVGQHARAAAGKDLRLHLVAHGEHGVCRLAAQGGHVHDGVEIAGVKNHQMGHGVLTVARLT